MLLKGYVYVIADQERKYAKIGMTHKLSTRLSGVQLGSPVKLELVLALETPHMKRVEKELHAKLAHLWLRGEWFNFSPEIETSVRALVNEEQRIIEFKPGAPDPPELKGCRSYGDIVRRGRMRRRLSQSELAKLCDLRQGTISDVENDEGTRIDTLLKIFEVLGIEWSFSLPEEEYISCLPGGGGR